MRTHAMRGLAAVFALAFALCAPAAHARARAAAASAVTGALAELQRSGAMSAGDYAHDLHSYLAAQRALGRLSGTRRGELSAVLENLRSIAAAGELSASRAPGLFLTLQRNTQW